MTFRPLNEAAADKILQYRADYNNRPSNTISFMLANGDDACDFVPFLFFLFFFYYKPSALACVRFI